MDEAGRGWCLLMTRSGANGWGVDQTLFVREGECVCCLGGISLYLSIDCFCICKNRCHSRSSSIWEMWVCVFVFVLHASKQVRVCWANSICLYLLIVLYGFCWAGAFGMLTVIHDGIICFARDCFDFLGRNFHQEKEIPSNVIKPHLMFSRILQPWGNCIDLQPFQWLVPIPKVTGGAQLLAFEGLSLPQPEVIASNFRDTLGP